MAFKSHNLSVLAYSNGFTLWHYTADDDSAAYVQTAGYFNLNKNMLRPGDKIEVSCAGHGFSLSVDKVSADDAAVVRPWGDTGPRS